MGTTHAHQLYDEDFLAWTRSQASELRRFARSRPNLPLDLEHIAEEIADLGTSRRDALRSWTRRIIDHLLLLQYAQTPDPRRGWVEEVLNFRSEIEGRLSATLRRDLRRQLPRVYDRPPRRPKAAGPVRRQRSFGAPPRALPLHARSGARRLLARRQGARSRAGPNPLITRSPTQAEPTPIVRPSPRIDET